MDTPPILGTRVAIALPCECLEEQQDSHFVGEHVPWPSKSTQYYQPVGRENNGGL